MLFGGVGIVYPSFVSSTLLLMLTLLSMLEADEISKSAFCHESY
jgi:hypothetical protein